MNCEAAIFIEFLWQTELKFAIMQNAYLLDEVWKVETFCLNSSRWWRKSSICAIQPNTECDVKKVKIKWSL